MHRTQLTKSISIGLAVYVALVCLALALKIPQLRRLPGGDGTTAGLGALDFIHVHKDVAAQGYTLTFSLESGLWILLVGCLGFSLGWCLLRKRAQ